MERGFGGVRWVRVMFGTKAGEVWHGASVTCRGAVFNEMLFPARTKEIDDCWVAPVLINGRRSLNQII